MGTAHHYGNGGAAVRGVAHYIFDGTPARATAVSSRPGLVVLLVFDRKPAGSALVGGGCVFAVPSRASWFGEIYN